MKPLLKRALKPFAFSVAVALGRMMRAQRAGESVRALKSDIPNVPVQDVQVNGVSTLQNNIAKVQEGLEVVRLI